MGLKEYVKNKIKSTDEEIRANFGTRRAPRILVIGWNTGPTDEYVQMLHGIGWNVFWVGQSLYQRDYDKIFNNARECIAGKRYAEAGFIVDNLGKSMQYRPDLCIEKVPGYPQTFNGMMGPCPVPIQHMNFKSLLGVVGSDWDVVLQFQNWIDWMGADGHPEAEKSPIPFAYFFSEPFYHVLPRVAWHVIGSSPQMCDLAKYHNRGRFVSYQSLPWACRIGVLDTFNKAIHGKSWTHQFKDGKAVSVPDVCNAQAFDVLKRPVKCSFAGKIHNFEFYEERKDIVYKVAGALGDGFEGHWMGNKGEIGKDGLPVLQPERGKGALNIIEYAELLARSQYGLNVNTQFGANFRDFEVPACAGILLTKERSDFKGLGFRDGENCMFYKTAEEAAEIARMEPDPDIAIEGFKLVVGQHTYAQRVEQLLRMLEAMM